MLEPMLELGFGNYVFPARVVAILNPDIEYTKRLVKSHKEHGTAIDVTSNKKLKAVVVLDTGDIVLSAIDCEEISERYNKHVRE